MAKSFVFYPSQTGATTDYAIPFDYLDQGFVKATVGGAPAPLTFISTYMVRFATAPVGDLKVYRETSTEIINEYSNGSILDANDLNVSLYQTMHITEETADNTLQNDIDGNWDANGLRIKNVANPVDPQDVATKNWAETAGGSFVAEATTQANRSKNEADRSKTEGDRSTTQATNSANSAATALTRLNAATVQADRAEDEADRSYTEAERAKSEANRATSQAGVATTQAGTATTKASEASTSATTATTQAGIATTQAGTATTQAGIATTKAGEASNHAAAALAHRNSAESHKNTAEGFKNAAEAAAASINATNLLTKDGNLAGLTDPAAARVNLGVAVYSPATTTANGLMSAADKTKLDAVKSMANRNVTISTAAPSGGADGDIWLRYS